jgi:serine/threonine protein kinase|mmetsp:Transcript_59479/g.97972  ORF Transcript_59479/g.97972 Transcript_59479/m.97972 type:complete len:510 (-) Transcript_59479:232-1761(-)
MASIPEAPSGTFNGIYQLGEELGRGSFAVVHKCVNKKSGKSFAVKVVNKCKTTPSQLKDLDAEISIMRKLRHESIISLYEVVASATSLYIILELVRGGDLFHMISKLKHYSETVAAQLMANFMSALDYMHKQGVAHRDLKPDNMLLMNPMPKNMAGLKYESKLLSEIKIADFGFAQECGNEDNMTKCCGTPYYIAPEVLECGLYKTGPPYGKQVDMWSAGVICYVLLSGSPAFQAQKRDQLFKLIVKAEFSFTGQLWDRISADAKDLISKLLVKSPKKRYTAQDALGHQWLKDSQPDNHLPNLQARLGTFNARAKLKGAVYGVEAAHRMLYLTWCTRTNLKPNSGVLAEMEAQGDEESEVLDLNKNYVGSKGIPAIMQVVASKNKLKKLMLAANEIENTDVSVVVSTLEKHPSVTHIDLSNNPLSRTAAKKLQYLVQKNPAIQRMDLDGTDIHPDRIQCINAQLQVNQDMLAAACKEAGKKVPKEARDPKKGAPDAAEAAATAAITAAP